MSNLPTPIEPAIVKPVTLTIGTTPAGSTPFDSERFRMMYIRRLSGNVAELTVYISEAEDGTYVQLENVDGEDMVLSSLSAKARTIESDIFAAHWIKFVGDDTGTILVGGKS